MKIIRHLEVPTGDILVVEGTKGYLEMLSLGDYGQQVNLNQHKPVMDGTPLMPLTDKWVITVSTQYGCSVQCKFCSPAGTKVNTPHGERSIETLRKNELVIGYDMDTPKINKIDDTYEREYEGELVCLELENGKTLKLTPNHEVFTKNGIKMASELLNSDDIIEF